MKTSQNKNTLMKFRKQTNPELYYYICWHVSSTCFKLFSSAGPLYRKLPLKIIFATLVAKCSKASVAQSVGLINETLLLTHLRDT